MRARVAKIVLSAVVLAGAGAYLISASLSGAVVYERTVDQVVEQRTTLAGSRVKVGGVLVAGSRTTRPGTLEHSFALKGARRTVHVSYSGAWPDAAADGRELMVEGTIESDGDVRAEQVIARCPSRYKRRVTQDR